MHVHACVELDLLTTKHVSVCGSDAFTQCVVRDNVNGRVALGEGEREV